MSQFNVNRLSPNVKDMLIGDENFPIERARKLVDKDRKESCINFLSRQDITTEDLRNFADSPYKEVRKIIAAHDKTDRETILKLLSDVSDEVVITVITQSYQVTIEFITKEILNQDFLKYASYDVLLNLAYAKGINGCAPTGFLACFMAYDVLDEDEIKKFGLDFYLKLIENYHLTEKDFIFNLDNFAKNMHWNDDFSADNPLVKIFIKLLINRDDLQTLIQNEFINDDRRINIWKYAPMKFTHSLSEKTYRALDKCINDNLYDMDWEKKEFLSFYTELFSSRYINPSSVIQFVGYYVGEHLDLFKIYAEEITEMFKVLCNNEYLTEEIIYFIYRELKHFVKHEVITDIKNIYACLYYNRNCPNKLKEVLKDNM